MYKGDNVCYSVVFIVVVFLGVVEVLGVVVLGVVDVLGVVGCGDV